MKNQAKPRNPPSSQKTPRKPTREQNPQHNSKHGTAEDEHIGATEGQVSDTTPPAGNLFEDEPKQG